MQWIPLEKSGDGWMAEIPMCTFGVNKTDNFQLHVYGVVNGVEGLVVNSSVDHMAPAGHNYEHQYDKQLLLDRQLIKSYLHRNQF